MLLLLGEGGPRWGGPRGSRGGSSATGGVYPQRAETALPTPGHAPLVECPPPWPPWRAAWEPPLPPTHDPANRGDDRPHTALDTALDTFLDTALLESDNQYTAPHALHCTLHYTNTTALKLFQITMVIVEVSLSCSPWFPRPPSILKSQQITQWPFPHTTHLSSAAVTVESADSCVCCRDW